MQDDSWKDNGKKLVFNEVKRILATENRDKMLI